MSKTTAAPEKSNPARPRLRSWLAGITIMLVVFFAVSIPADRSLKWFGLSPELRIQVAHPANYTEKRKTIEYEYTFRTNSQGLRDREIPLEKARGEFRVLVAGDSYAEGEGVEAGQRFTDLLEKDFSANGREVRFINGGLSGAGPLEYGRMIFNAGLKYHPDAVLVCIYANDIININLKSTTEMMFQTALRPTGKIYRAAYLLWPYSFAAAKSYHDFKQKISASKTSNFIKTITEPAKAQGVPQQDIERWRAGLPRDLVQAVNRGELNGNGLAYGLLYPAYWSDAIDLQSQTIKAKAQKMLEFMVKIVKTCQARSITVAFVYIPSPFQYDPAALDPGVRNPWRESGVFMDKRWLTEKTAAQRLFEEYAKITGVPFLDLTPALRQAAQSQKGITYPLDGHWTPSGHKLAEEAIARWIRENRVFPIQ